MSIRRFFDQNVVIRRLKTVSGNKKQFQGTATVEAHIQEADREARQLLGIIEERAWIAWLPVDAVINEGDRVTDKNGTVYHVREKTIKDYGMNTHIEVLLMEQNA